MKTLIRDKLGAHCRPPHGSLRQPRRSVRARFRTSIVAMLVSLAILTTVQLEADDSPRLRLDLRPIDRSRVGTAMPDSSAALDLNEDGQVEILTSMQDANGHPEVLLYNCKSDGDLERTAVGVVKRHKDEMEWLAVGRPFPGDSRVCVAASVQHKQDGQALGFPSRLGG